MTVNWASLLQFDKPLHGLTSETLAPHYPSVWSSFVVHVLVGSKETFYASNQTRSVLAFILAHSGPPDSVAADKLCKLLS